MILADSSALIEFLRASGSTTRLRVGELLANTPRELAICEVVQMEILAGARNGAEAVVLGAFLSQFSMMRIQSTDYDTAAALYRRCRRQGETVRKLTDCLIAAVAIRAGIAVLHNDRDFDVLARHTELQLDSVSG